MKQLSVDSRENNSPALVQAQALYSEKTDVRAIAEVRNYVEMTKLLKKEESSDN